MAHMENQGIYVASEKEQAFHPMPACPRAFQCWYHDAIFDNGYNAVISWDLTERSARVSLRICDPDGKMTEARRDFLPDEVKASADALDITMAGNRVQGKFPRYEMHFSNGGTGCDLAFECTAPAVRQPPDGVCIGRESAPATPVYMGYIYRPRCKVSGKLTLAGREIQVSGEGYADHQWNNVPVAETFHHWYWGKVHLPGYSLVWWDGQLREGLGSQRVKWLVGFQGGRLIKFSRDANIYVDPGDLEIDQASGVVFPKRTTLIMDEDDIKGTVTYAMKHMIMKVALRPTTPRTMFSYFRYLADVDVKLNIGGERVDIKAQAIHEAGI